MSNSATALQERPMREHEQGNLQNAELPSVADQVLANLDSVFEPTDGLRWLGASQPDLGGSPIELIESGHADRVLRMLIRLEEGVHV